MLCTRNDDIIVAVFYDVKTCVTTSTDNQSSAREFLNQARNVTERSLLAGCVLPVERVDFGLRANTRVLEDHEISDVLGNHTGCIKLEPECGDMRAV